VGPDPVEVRSLILPRRHQGPRPNPIAPRSGDVSLEAQLLVEAEVLDLCNGNGTGTDARGLTIASALNGPVGVDRVSSLA
jgi:hypothetical protein